MFQKLKLIAVIGGLLAAAGVAEAGSNDMQTFEVTISNLNRAQIISPPVVAVHTPDFRLFETGGEASYGLVKLAEDGMTDHLVGELLANPKVRDVAVAAGGIPPGNSRSVYVNGRPGMRLSAAGMLITTNDAFFAVRGLTLPGAGSQSSTAPAYDAGSEVNNEDCDYIPGPPCGNGGERFPKGAEGFIHIHNGIHGVGDISPAVWDWRNPVARVTVRRVSDDDESDDESDDERHDD